MKGHSELPLVESISQASLEWSKKQSISLRRVLQISLLFALACFGAAAQTSLPPTLTPPPQASPRITGARLYGAYPDTAFSFLITATGNQPMTYGVSGLPAGLSVNSSTGLITGNVSQRGTYDTMVTVNNGAGVASRPLRIVIGDQIGLTPAMGWNPFNTYASTFTDANIRADAAVIVSSGLINYGYQYVNLDEGWEGPRSTSAPYGPFNPGPLTANSKFPDFPGLISYVHSLNLKFGLYSTPLPKGYVGFTGGTYVTPPTSVNINGENLLASPQDVQQFVDWGVDYLKYDGDNEASIDAQTTSASVRSATRDIVYSLSQNSGAQIGVASLLPKFSNSWRASYDANDEWSSIANNGFLSVTYPNNGGIKPSPNDWAPYTGPGRFADLDMLVEGYVAFGGSTSISQSRLTPDEQYTHFSQWSLIASPLLMGCDLTQLDQFTLGLFGNAEVLDVDQDPLGLQATRKSSTGDAGVQVWSRPLADGSVAVGLFNLSGSSATVTANWSDLGINGNQLVHDLWRQQDLGNYNGGFSGTVNTHGVLLVRITPTAFNRPQIAGQPVNAIVQEGQPATFSVAATGNNLTYQWTRNGNPISGANSSTYTTPATVYSDNGSYFRVIVNDDNNTGQVYSYETKLKVYGASTTDLALNQPTTASGSNFTVSYPASNAVDGSTTSDWWGLHIDPSWLYVDLGANYNINEIKILTDVSSSFTVDVAPEGSNNLSAEDPNAASPWTTVGSASGIATNGNISDFAGLSGFGRYVRFESLSRYATDEYSLPTIHELYVYGNYTNGQPGGPPQPVNTSTSLAISPNTSSLSEGASYTLTATVSPASGSTTPTGNVVFTIGSSTQSVGLNSGGVAAYNGTAPSSAGTLSLSAAYQGTSAFNGSSSSTLNETVTGGTTGGGPIAIPNYSFEQGGAGYNVPSNWNFASSGTTGSNYAVQYISNATNPPAEDGSNYWAPGDFNPSAAPYGTSTSTLTTSASVGSFAANTTYTLTVALADPADGTDPSLKSIGFQLLSNGSVVANFASTGIPQGGNFTDYSLTFDTASNSSVVGQNITIALVYSYSGQYNRNAYFDNVRLSAAADSGGGPTQKQVPLAGAANTTGIYTDGSSFTTGGIDGDGYAYSASRLGSSLTLAGTTFNFAAANQPNVVKGLNQAAVPLASGKYSTLSFLAIGLNGGQTSQTFTVNYTDGSSDQFTRSLSDWFSPQSFNGETTAIQTPYRDTSSGGEDNRPFNLYQYSLAINNTKTVNSLILPNNGNVAVLAITLVP